MIHPTPPITSPLPPAIFLMGPTAAGKTDVALELCQHLPCEIISVDATLVYRGLDIGAAKPTVEQRAVAPHHLIDIRDPAQPYSVAEFREDALHAMTLISQADKIPLLVGGSMLYFKALRDGLAALPAADSAVRAAIEADAKQYGWPYVHRQLAAVDPVAAERIHPHHSQRLERALEVYRLTGQTITALRAQQAHTPLPYRVLQCAIAPLERSVLHARIEQRFHHMLAQGLVNEVRALYERGDLHDGLPAVRAVGYRQVWQYLVGEYDFDTMVERSIIASRQLAKRQLTWLRSWPDLHWLHTDAQGYLVASDNSATEALSVVGAPPYRAILSLISDF
jgi:tRNA dimethylallyltransferase